ncbi:MAG: PorT family protein [Dysgonamonadaceae bacterium]|jgi:hypothetical protein|nr:PorT family protein [Dysgonamonadaceae bacterium]
MNKKTYLFLLFSCFLCTPFFAQQQKVHNQPYGDQKLYHFGIIVGINFQDLILTNNGLPAGNETWYATIPNYTPGLSVGLLADMYLNPFMNLRLSPALHFGDKNFEFVEPATGQHVNSMVRSSYITLPLDLKIRSLRLNNYRPYLIAGVFGALDLGLKKDDPILLKPFDYGFNIGFGCDFYLPIVKIAPELRFSFGLTDLIEHNRTDLTEKDKEKYSKAIAKGVSRMITLTLNFE